MEITINDIESVFVSRTAHVEVFDNDYNSPVEYKCETLNIILKNREGESFDICAISPEHGIIEYKTNIRKHKV